MKNKINKFFIGEECYDCKAFGVYCAQPGILPVYSADLPSQPIAPFRGSAVFIDGNQALQTPESIGSCPAKTGGKNQETGRSQTSEYG